jgi:hypothetical protein
MPAGTSQALRLRPLRTDDEAAFRDGQLDSVIQVTSKQVPIRRYWIG